MLVKQECMLANFVQVPDEMLEVTIVLCQMTAYFENPDLNTRGLKNNINLCFFPHSKAKSKRQTYKQ